MKTIRRLAVGTVAAAILAGCDPSPPSDPYDQIAPGVKFSAWTFGDQVPGPTVRARVGDKIKFSMTNRSDQPVPGISVGDLAAVRRR
jgi:hypothetical protein